MHLLKVVFGVESACEIMYTPSSPVSVKNKHTVNKKWVALIVGDLMQSRDLANYKA